MAAAGMVGQGASAGGGMMGGIANYIHTRDYVRPMLKKARIQAGEDVRAEGRKLGGRQVAAYSKAGVRTDKGSALEVMGSTAAQVEVEALRTMFEFEKKIFEARTMSTMSMVSSIMMAGGSFMGQAGQAFGNRGAAGGAGGGNIPSGAYSGWNGRMAGGSSGMFGSNNSAVNTLPMQYTQSYGNIA